MYKAKKATATILSVSLLATVLVFAVSCASDSSRAFDSEDKRIELYAIAYESLLGCLSEANLMPEFDSAELVEESLAAYLNEASVQALAGKLDDMHSYSVSVSHGHDRSDATESIGVAYAYLYYDSEYNGSNKLKIEGFVNDNTYPVYMYFSYRNGAWGLIDSEIYQADWSVPTMHPYSA